MKTRLIFLVLLIACFSCGTNNKPVSDAQKEKIKGEVKEVVNTFIKGCEEAISDMVLGTFLDSPDFVYTYNGNSFSYKQIGDVMKPSLSTLINQKGTIIDEKYAVLDNATVLYTNNSNWLMNFKDGHSILQNPWIVQLLFKKIDNKWIVISAAESGTEQSVKNSETSKELNQVELMKQFLGNWKCELGKDSTVFWNAKPYGTGQDTYWKIVSNDKIVSEGKALYGYDKSIDKYIYADMGKGKDIVLTVYWMITNSKFEYLPYSAISNPEKAPWRGEGEFKSPDIFIMNGFAGNKPVGTWTYTRVK
jgi:hypothetical protein